MSGSYKENVTFRIDSRLKTALDAIAESLDRDRSYALNEAVRAYIELQEWQIKHLKEGLRQADAGEFASDRAVNKHLLSGANEN